MITGHQIQFQICNMNKPLSCNDVFTCDFLKTGCDSRSERARSNWDSPSEWQIGLHACEWKNKAMPLTPKFPSPYPMPSDVCIWGSVHKSSTPCTSTTIKRWLDLSNVKWLNACNTQPGQIASGHWYSWTKNLQLQITYKARYRAEIAVMFTLVTPIWHIGYRYYRNWKS